MRESKHDLAIDGTLAGDDAVAANLLLLHAEVRAPVGDQRVVLDETALVEQKVDALPGGQLVVRVLLINSNLATTYEGLSPDFVQPLSESLFLLGGGTGREVLHGEVSRRVVHHGLSGREASVL